MVEWPQSHSVVLDMRIVHAVMELLSHNQHSGILILYYILTLV